MSPKETYKIDGENVDMDVVRGHGGEPFKIPEVYLPGIIDEGDEGKKGEVKPFRTKTKKWQMTEEQKALFREGTKSYRRR